MPNQPVDVDAYVAALPDVSQPVPYDLIERLVAELIARYPS